MSKTKRLHIDIYMFDLTFLQKRPFFLYAVLFFLAIFSRLSAINRYITPDELIWVFRSIQFTEAMRDARWIDTITSGHPGVITTWIGALGIQIQLLFQPETQVSYDWLTKVAWLTPTNIEALRELSVFLTAGRLGIIVLNSLGVLLIFWFVRRLLGFETGLLTAVFLAVEPFVAGLAGLLHVDATMTLFSTIALLSLGVAVQEADDLKPSLRFTAVSGICSSLALLTKSPAILLVALSLFFLLIKGLFNQTSEGHNNRHWLGWSLLVWCGSFVVTSIIAFPALWSSFSAVFELISGDANRHIGDALRPTFFLGEENFDHGPIFYPISLAFRLSPMPFLGLFLSIGLMLQWGRQRYATFEWSKAWRDLQHPTVLFILWTVGFIAGITLAAKKFDRYALPVIPILLIWGSLGWLGFIKQRQRPYLWFSVVIIGTLLNALYFQPNPMSAYNFLLGGPWVAQNVMTVGWGEPISLATNWIETTGYGAESSATGSIPQSIAPFYTGTPLVATAEFFPQADYIIWTQNDRQLSGVLHPPLNEGAELIQTIRYGGLTQAWIYKQGNPVANTFITSQLEAPKTFNGRIGIVGTALQAKPQQIDVLIQWQLQNDVENGRYAVRLTAVDEYDLTWYETEQPLVNETFFYPEHWPTSEATIRYQIPFEDGTPPARYTVKIALIDEQTASLLPLYDAEDGFEGTSFEVGTATLPPSPKTNVSVLPIDTFLQNEWEEVALTLLGADRFPENLTTGEPLPVRLFWQANGQIDQNYQLRFAVGDIVTDFSLSRYEPTRWEIGEVIQEQYRLAIPAQFNEEKLSVSVMLLDTFGQPAADSTVELGNINITPLDRLFTLPTDIEVPLFYQFDDQLILRGVDVQETAVSPDQYELTLYWEVLTPPTSLVSAFVHMVNPDATNFAQSDQWPGGLPSDLWAAGQIIVDKHTIDLPDVDPPDLLELAVGVYTAENGVRLTAVDNQNNGISENRVFLPIPVKIP
ncbi:MAG: glycosyltransferase family 39 protein [Chloroflexota bacterium]